MDVDTPIEVIDEHYLALCAFVTIGIQLACFFIAYVCSFDTITDFSGSTNFIVVALLTLFLNKMYYSRQILLTSLVIASRLELALFLFARVLKRKKDSRFDGMREKFFVRRLLDPVRLSPAHAPLTRQAFLFFWIFQMFWIYLVSLPVMWVNGEVIQPGTVVRGCHVPLGFASPPPLPQLNSKLQTMWEQPFSLWLSYSKPLAISTKQSSAPTPTTILEFVTKGSGP